jgi:hypothetical protein
MTTNWANFSETETRFSKTGQRRPRDFGVFTLSGWIT